jgi:hypothetical protein
MQPFDSPFQRKEHFNTECFVFARIFSQLALAPSARSVSSLVIPLQRARLQAERSGLADP